ncbi:MAG: hypothetical protein HQL69_18580 [Magnetococcales bacterium]|nr:hypothetical protein [Magnetococcales bacterium]
MLKTKNNLIFIVIFICIIALSVYYKTQQAQLFSAEDPINYLQNNWPQACQKIRADLLKESNSLVKATPPPSRPTNPSTNWSFNWNGIQIPLPPISYNELIINRVYKQQGFDIFLTADDGTIISLYNDDNFTKPMENVFGGLQNIDGKPLKEDQDREITYTLFGGPVSIPDIMRPALHQMPQDLTCKSEAWKKEASISIGLILLAVARPFQIETIHEVKGGYEGWIEKGKTETHTHWKAFLYDSKKPDNSWDISMIIPKDSPHLELGLFLVEPTRGGLLAPQNPLWLKQLNQALQHNTPQKWQTLLKTMQTNSFGNKSLKSVQTIIQEL